MKWTRMLLLVAATVLLLSGCFGYGHHPGNDGYHDDRMDRHGRWHENQPCPEESRDKERQSPPCQPQP